MAGFARHAVVLLIATTVSPQTFEVTNLAVRKVSHFGADAPDAGERVVPHGGRVVARRAPPLFQESKDMTTIMSGLTSQDQDTRGGLGEFVYNGVTVRIYGDPTNPVLIGKELCDALGITKHRDALAGVPEWAKGASISVDTLGGPQTMSTVNEAGFLYLTLRSNKPDAVELQRLVCVDILPAIRRQGYYLHNPTPTSEAVIKLRLRLKAAELREEAGKLDALARGDHEIVTEVPVGYMAIDQFLLDGEHATPVTLASVRSRMLARLKGAQPLTQRVQAHPGSRSGSRRRRLYRTIDLHNAAVAAGLMQTTLTFTPEA